LDDSAKGRGARVRIRIGIVSWNTAALLDRCLAALPAALAGAEATVTVVDNASTDNSVQIASRHPGIQVICNPVNVGYARAMNQALAGGDTDVLVALNPDTEPPRESLVTLAKRLLQQPDVGLVVPRLVGCDGALQHSVYRFPSSRQVATVLLSPRFVLRRGLGERWWAEGHARHDRATDIDWAIGAVHVIRAAALDGQPPYDETSFMYVEDLDLCWLLARRGWRRRLEPEVTVKHVGNAAGAQAWGDQRTARWLARTYEWYERTHGRGAKCRWAALNSGVVVVHLITLLPLAIAGSHTRRQRVSELARVLPVHLRAVVRRSRPVAG
jgi:N-acetylglucosaminyl-diphospho-decaprenol L-rhamnosyltransferase